MSEYRRDPNTDFRASFDSLHDLIKESGQDIAMRALRGDLPPDELAVALPGMPQLELYQFVPSMGQPSEVGPIVDFKGTNLPPGTFRHWYTHLPESFAEEAEGAAVLKILRHKNSYKYDVEQPGFLSVSVPRLCALYAPEVTASEDLQYVTEVLVSSLTGEEGRKELQHLSKAATAIVRQGIFCGNEVLGPTIELIVRLRDDPAPESAAIYRQLQRTFSHALGKILVDPETYFDQADAMPSIIETVEAYEQAGLLDSRFWVDNAISKGAAARVPAILGMLHRRIVAKENPLSRRNLAGRTCLEGEYLAHVINNYRDDPRRAGVYGDRLAHEVFNSRRSVNTSSLIGQANLAAQNFNRRQVNRSRSERMPELVSNNPNHTPAAFLYLASYFKHPGASLSTHLNQFTQDLMHADVLRYIVSEEEVQVVISDGLIALRFPEEYTPADIESLAVEGRPAHIVIRALRELLAR